MITLAPTGPGHRPSLQVPVKKEKRKKPLGVEALAQRFAEGKDLWSGNDLTGQNQEHWLLLALGKPEKALTEEELEEEIAFQEECDRLNGLTLD